MAESKNIEQEKKSFENDYKIVLNSYLANKSEESLYQAYNLTRQAILSKMSLIDLIIAYQKAFSDILREFSKEEIQNTFVKDGLEFLSEALSPFEMTFRGYQDTIDALKKKSSNLQEEKSKMEHIVNKMTEGMLVIDTNGIIQLFNSKLQYYFKKFFDFDLRIGQNLNDISPNRLSDKIKECFNSETDLVLELEIDKEFFLRMISNKLFRKDGKKDVYFSLSIEFQDISSYVQFDKIRTSFISMVSHELKNPIMAINSSINQLHKYSDRLNDETRDKLRNIILKNSELIIEISNDLGLLTQIDEKKLTLNYSNFNIFNSIKKILIQLQPKITEKNIQINIKCSPDHLINADMIRIEQIIRILLDNAIKYSYNDSSVEIIVFLEKEYNTIKIKDFGIGIKESDLNNLFQRFFRSDDVRQIQGTGLGLSIAKKMVEMHNGEIKVFSKFRQGSTFEIFLPIIN